MHVVIKAESYIIRLLHGHVHGSPSMSCFYLLQWGYEWWYFFSGTSIGGCGQYFFPNNFPDHPSTLEGDGINLLRVSYRSLIEIPRAFGAPNALGTFGPWDPCATAHHTHALTRPCTAAVDNKTLVMVYLGGWCKNMSWCNRQYLQMICCGVTWRIWM